MAIQVNEIQDGRVIEVTVSDKLTAADYQHFVPTCERLIKQYGKISILFEMRDFHGWEAGALWEDIKFDLKHFRDIERLAMIGDQRWEKWMAEFCRPFTTAKIRFFDPAQEESARQWVVSGEVPTGGAGPTGA